MLNFNTNAINIRVDYEAPKPLVNALILIDNNQDARHRSRMTPVETLMMKSSLKGISMAAHPLIFVVFASFLMTIFTHDRASAQTADRVVVAVNSIPYTQLQVERYISVKESLRDDAKTSQTVQESNWPMALEAFIRDMMIHQDATKSSGFRPTKEAIYKLRALSDKNIGTAPQFKADFVRLGLDRAQIETEVLKIATVENYRRGKKSLDINGTQTAANWEEELVKRSIVRYFDDAKTWKQINPQP